MGVPETSLQKVTVLHCLGILSTFVCLPKAHRAFQYSRSFYWIKAQACLVGKDDLPSRCLPDLAGAGAGACLGAGAGAARTELHLYGRPFKSLLDFLKSF